MTTVDAVTIGLTATELAGVAVLAWKARGFARTIEALTLRIERDARDARHTLKALTAALRLDERVAQLRVPPELDGGQEAPVAPARSPVQGVAAPDGRDDG
jgi:hypothetical protein